MKDKLRVLVLVSSLIGFVVAFIKSFVLHLKYRVDHSGFSKSVVNKARSKASEAKAWMLTVLSRLQHSPTFA